MHIRKAPTSLGVPGDADRLLNDGLISTDSSVSINTVISAL